MNLQFNADEIFRVAERIEENGARFYRRAAEMLLDPDATRLLLMLAETEDEHKRIFESMRNDLVESGSKMEITPGIPGYDFIKAWADGSIFKTDVDPVEHLSGEETGEDILELAIEIEKNSMVFYLGMKQSISSEKDRNKIDKIIEEELRHYVMLSRDLERVRGELN